ncbi:MAG TPA: hypothetical protein PKW30_06315 [Campylobacterales bacterium]|nr:hypothetical protein [Campylobacterales bacterium]
MGFTTKAIHSQHAKADGFGALRYPIYQNAAFEFESAEDLEAVFKGKKGGAYIYKGLKSKYRRA